MTAPVSPSQPPAEPVRRCKHDVSEDCPACAEETIAGLKAAMRDGQAWLKMRAETEKHPVKRAVFSECRDFFAALSPSTPAVSR